MSDQHDLALLLKSRFPLVIIETHEEARALKLLETIANQEQWPLHTWSIADGLQRVMPREAEHETHELTAALRCIDKSIAMGVYVLLDAHPFLEEPLNQRLVKEIARDYHQVPRTLVFVGPRLDLPRDLQRLAARFELSLASADTIRQVLREEAQLWRAEGGAELRGENDAAHILVQHLAGMPLDDARRLIRQAIRDDGALNQADVGRVLKLKHEALGAAGVLSLELDTARFDAVGGQGALKRWLELRRRIFLQPEQAKGLDAPKGILLLGVQGSGKSLAAKAIAGSWGLFIDLPDAAVRRDIFTIHLRLRELDPAQFDVAALAAAADGYSGAEIEQAIVAALYESRAANAALDTAHLRAELARTRPLSVLMAEQVQALRDWARTRTVPAA